FFNFYFNFSFFFFLPSHIFTIKISLTFQKVLYNLLKIDSYFKDFQKRKKKELIADGKKKSHTQKEGKKTAG
ncbi:MAG: hypothetical protein D6785_02335, partial [Planctomycetota bacterium]